MKRNIKVSCTNQLRYSFREMEKLYNEHQNDIFDYANTHQELIKQEDTKQLKYLVSMYFYPSGSAHLGHGRVATILDVYSRYLKKLSYKVYCPMGFDSFGLPAEEAAKRNNINPATWTDNNIKVLKQDLKNLNVSYNWESGLMSHDVKYYSEQQKIIQILWKNDLLEQKESWVNWDPVLQTVLANEQVSKDGICWRSGAKVQKKKIVQWFIKSSKYAEELLDGLQNLDWPNRVKNAQKKWIGKNQGIYYDFNSVSNENHAIKVFTSAPECIYGVTFLVISPESSYASLYYKQELDTYKENGQVIPIDYVVCDKLNKKIPLFFGDYVIYNHGTGAVMGVPSLNKQDLKFAQQHNLEIIEIMDKNNILINSNELNGLCITKAREKIFQDQKPVTLYRIKDWCISRQRYWGVPLPFIHCPKCGIVPANLPVELPVIKDFKNTQGNPLEHCQEWVNVPCPQCKTPSKRETDTMDTFVDSSWYYLRYPVHNNNHSNDKTLYPLPLDLYIGGIEHATMHLIYTRVMCYMLRDVNLLDDRLCNGNLIKKLFCQGMVVGPSYQGAKTKKYYNPFNLIKKNNKYYGQISDSNQEEEIIVGPVEKISKSLNNGAPISVFIDKHGSDVFRLFVISDTPPEQDMILEEGKLNKIYLFLQKVWQLHWCHREDRNSECHAPSWIDNIKYSDCDSQQTIDQIDRIFKIIGNNIESLKLNVYIGNIRKLFNILENINQTITKKTHRSYFIKWLNCFDCVCPCLSKGCLDLLGEDYNKQYWYHGVYNKKQFRQLIIQINNAAVKFVRLPDTTKDIVTFASQFIQQSYTKHILVDRGDTIIVNFLTN